MIAPLVTAIRRVTQTSAACAEAPKGGGVGTPLAVAIAAHLDAHKQLEEILRTLLTERDREMLLYTIVEMMADPLDPEPARVFLDSVGVDP